MQRVSFRQDKVSRCFSLVSMSLVVLLFMSGMRASAEDKGTITGLQQMGKAFAHIAEKASPAVVGIETEKIITRDKTIRRSPFGDQFFEDDFFDYFFRRRSPRRRLPRERSPKSESRRLTQGSGFIISSSEGYILTNNHVIAGADKITVILGDKRKFKAEVVGTDPESEVAVIKIDAENLTSLELGDSDALEVGEWVVAIGNPFGLTHTVTAGIVSAKSRTVGLTDYDDFIQTDAAINPGNSGGPLLNLEGKAIGINSAIVTRSGGYMGIGLAIPINMARHAYEQLVESGKVVRGWLGVTIEDLTPKKAPFFGLPEDTKGVLIPQVFEDSAAEKGGLKDGDIVVEFEGKPVEDKEAFRNRVAMMKPGTGVKIVVLRDGRRKSLRLKLGERPPMDQLVPGRSNVLKKLGLTVQNLTDDLAQRLGFEDLSGVVVTEVEAGSAASRVGISVGTLIMEVNREPVRNVREFNMALEQVEKGGTILLLVQDQYYRRFVVLTVPEE